MPTKVKIDKMRNGDIFLTIPKMLLRDIVKGKIVKNAFEICCDCSLTHRVIYQSDDKGGIEAICYRDDAITEDLRHQKKKKK